MIDGNAKIDPKAGGKFEIWDGSIVGQTLELNSKTRRVVQNWRYDNWPKDYFSKITIEFMPDRKDKTKPRNRKADEICKKGNKRSLCFSL